MLETCVCVLNHFSHVRLFVTHWIAPSRLLCPGDSPGKNTGVVAIPSSRAGTLCATKTTTIIITNERHEVMTQMKCMLLLFTLVLNKY